MADVFLSYAAEDRPRIKPLARAFEEAGLTVWWDRHIGTGSSFDVVIERELDAAGSIVVVWSKHSIGSEWVRTEAAEGAARGVLVPLQIDDVRPPLAFRRRQTAQLLDWPNGTHADALHDVIDSVRQLVLDRPSAVARGATPPTPVERPPIIVAVLPLSDRTAERNMGYLCEGLAEDLMNALFPIEGLRVLSATDTFAFKDSQRGTREIGASLGATVVLEGSVQHAGDRIAVAVRLVNVGDGVTIYSERFQRDADNVFEVQTEIAGRVVEGLRRKLGLGGTTQPVVEATGRHRAAYELLRLDPSKLVVANSGYLLLMAALECAIALDPHFGRAYFDLVQAYLSLDVSSTDPRHAQLLQDARFAKAEAVLEQLEARDPGNPAVWDIRVELETDMAALANRCVELIRRGERVHPYPHPTGLNDVRGAYARVLAHSGLHREAFGYWSLIDRPHEPNQLDSWLHASGCLVAIGQFDRAVAFCSRIRASIPEHWVAPTWEFVARVAMGDLKGAATTRPDLPSFDRPLRALVLAERSRASNLHDAIKEAQLLSGNYFVHEMSGYAFLAIGEAELGLDHLERAVQTAARERHWMGFRLPILRVLFPSETTHHPRYRAILESLHLDDASRERLRAQAATLTPITGVEVGPLLPL